jgi:hypothetical protein
MNRARAGRADMQMCTGALRLWARMYATRETERAEQSDTRNFVDLRASRFDREMHMASILRYVRTIKYEHAPHRVRHG